MSSGVDGLRFGEISSRFFEELQKQGIEVQCVSVHDLSSSAPREPKSRDHAVISQFAEEVVSGFLNLGTKEGWSEGSDPRIGAAFTRHMVQEYLKKEKPNSVNGEILGKVLDSLANIGDFEGIPLAKEPEDGHRPTTNRVRYDSAVLGWQQHAITRMVGNVASKYNPKLPFFEILINSARSSRDNEICQPFHISIFNNEADIDKRRSNLSVMKMLPANLAHFTFYASYLNDPEKFLAKTHLKVGPNSTRLLEGLMYLQRKELKAQSVGNCWIKQPMRALLVSLYLETLSVRKELTPDGAWKEAVAMYKDIQKKAGIPIIEELLDNSGISGLKRTYAAAAIEMRSHI